RIPGGDRGEQFLGRCAGGRDHPTRLGGPDPQARVRCGLRSQGILAGRLRTGQEGWRDRGCAVQGAAMSTKSLLLALALATLSWPAAAQPPLISSPASGTLGLDPEAALSLAWTTVPNATSYRVELSEHPSFQPLLPLKDAQVPAQPGRLGQSYLVQFTDDTTLQP